jgi:hypothetical protein
LEFITININYCTALTAFYEVSIADDPHPVVLCVTDNVSAKKMDDSHIKKSIIEQAGEILLWLVD